MGNSDSDSENECFESAEESLDEDEEVKSVGTKSKESEDSEVVEPVCDNVDSPPQLEKDVSGNSKSYRKRPERVKRSISNTTKPVPKLPSTDTIFKADKIVPDAFFQDITSNLSKNINKSLSTLQQKSSNVKDLILSTLPVSSVNDGEGFSYDDKTTQAPLNESVIPVAEEVHQSKNQCNQLIENVIGDNILKKEDSFRGEKIIPESSRKKADRLCDSDGERKPPDIKRNSEEKSIEGDFNVEVNTLLCSTEEEISTLVAEERKDALGSKDEAESACEKINEDLEISSNVFSSSIEILQGANYSDIKKTDSGKILSDTNEKLGTTSATIEAEMELNKQQKNDSSKFLQSVEANQLPFDGNKLISSEPKAKNIGDSGNLFESKEKNLSKEPEEIAQVDTKCNLEELKTVLQSIVQNEIISSKGEFTTQEEKVEDNEASNDGWDDFDFSDEEVVNVMISKTDDKVADLKQTIADNKVTTDKKISSSDSKTKSQTKVESKTAFDSDFIQGRSKVSTKSEQAAQLEVSPDDTWDWDDNWDEIPEDKKEKPLGLAKTKNEKTQDDSPDVSKWSGWDTFAQKPQEKQGNWGLGSWGMDMLLNKATAVTQGISNVLEAGLGAPDPETLARMEKLERAKLQQQEMDEPLEHPEETPKKNSVTNVNLFPVSGITSLVAGVTSKIVEHSKIQEIGSKVITGGLDTLETFGKKTMEVLQEGDPGLKNKRALLMGNNKPVLSQVLREAREKADREMRKAEEKELAKKCHFETLFDDFQGMVHLEALEMLSRQCELKLEQIKSGMNTEEQEDLSGILEEVEQLCALDECELDLKSSVLDFKAALQIAVEPLKNEISVHKIIEIHENVSRWLEISSEIEVSLIIVNQKLVSTLAELAAATVHQFHKSGELLSVKECRKTVEEVDALSRLTNILCTEISKLSEKFILLSQSKGPAADGANNNSKFVAEATVVMKNSTSYIRQAFDLLIPVLQLGAAV